MKICNELVKKVKKYGYSDRTQGGQIYFLQGAKSILEKGQTKILGPASVIWDQISEIWPRKGQPGNPAANAGCESRERIVLLLVFVASQ